MEVKAIPPTPTELPLSMSMMLDLKKVFVVGTLGFIVICLGLFYFLTSSLNSRALMESAYKVTFIKLK